MAEIVSDYLENVDYPIDNNSTWKLLEENYNKYFLNFTGEKKPKIPMKIHQIWLGSELPIKYLRLIRTWIDKHSEWDYKLWTDRDIDSFGMINKKLFDAVNNNGLKTDIFRYEIIYRYGGLYIDTDFKCIKSFDDLLYLDFFSGSGHTTHPAVFPGLFATYPQNPLMLKIIQELTPKINSLPKNYGQMMQSIGADFYSDIILKYVLSGQDKVVIFPKNFFYPFPPELRDNVNVQKIRDLSKIYSYIKERTYCVHLWFTSWQWETQIIEEGDMPKPQPIPQPVKKKVLPRGDPSLGLDLFLRKIGKT